MTQQAKLRLSGAVQALCEGQHSARQPKQHVSAIQVTSQPPGEQDSQSAGCDGDAANHSCH